MIQMSNADKQARFRKKEHLKRRADNIFREWQMHPHNWKSKISQEDVQHSLDKAIDLPSGWTDKDYERAEQALDRLRADFFFGCDQLTYDVETQWDSLPASDFSKFTSDREAAIEKARALATHLISALKLSSCNDTEKAAALIEAMRFVGRFLAGYGDIPSSQANAMCLASIGREYDRPKWFAEKLAETIRQQIGKSLAREVGQHLIK